MCGPSGREGVGWILTPPPPEKSNFFKYTLKLLKIRQVAPGKLNYLSGPPLEKKF